MSQPDTQHTKTSAVLPLFMEKQYPTPWYQCNSKHTFRGSQLCLLDSLDSANLRGREGEKRRGLLWKNVPTL